MILTEMALNTKEDDDLDFHYGYWSLDPDNDKNCYMIELFARDALGWFTAFAQYAWREVVDDGFHIGGD